MQQQPNSLGFRVGPHVAFQVLLRGLELDDHTLEPAQYCLESVWFSVGVVFQRTCSVVCRVGSVSIEHCFELDD